MKQSVTSLLLFISLLFCDSAWAQYYYSCPFEANEVTTFCTDENELGISYEAGTDDHEAFWNSMSCLLSSPAPAWFAMKIDHPGDMAIKITHSGGEDVDFLCIGPFDVNTKSDLLEYVCSNADRIFGDDEDYSTGYGLIDRDYWYGSVDFEDDGECYTEEFKQQYLERWNAYYPVYNHCDDITYTSLGRRKCIQESGVAPLLDDPVLADMNNPCFRGHNDNYPSVYMMDCSYSSNSSEVCYIQNAKKDQWYLVLVTNYSQMPGTIGFAKIGGEATTNCSVIVDPISTGPYCKGQTIELTVNNAPDNATFLWTGPNGFSSTLKSPKIPNATVKHAGDYEVQMYVSGVASPVAAVTVEVFEPDTVKQLVVLSNGQEVELDGHTFTREGEFKFTDTNIHGCDSITIYTVTNDVNISPELSISAPLCEGEAAIVAVENLPEGAVCKWTTPSGDNYVGKVALSTNNVKISDAGVYSVDVEFLGVTVPTLSGKLVVYKKDTTVKEVVLHGDEEQVVDGHVFNSVGTFKFSETNSHGCDSLVIYNVTLIPEISLDEPTPVCEGESTSLKIMGLPSGATCSWHGPNGFTSTSSEIKFSKAKPENSGTYTVESLFAGNPLPVLSADVVVYKKDTMQKSVVLYADDNNVIDGHEFTSSGTFKFTETNSHGCDSLAIYKVTVITIPYLDDPEPVCEGKPVSMVLKDVPNGAIFSWSGPDGFTSSSKEVKFSSVKQANAGTYTVQFDFPPNVLETSGAEIPELSAELIVYKRDTVNEEVTILKGETYPFNDRELKTSGEYKAVLKNVNGCDSVIYLSLNVVKDTIDYLPIIPSPILTPQGDGINDTWQIENILQFPDAVVSIYDRFGKLIFQTDGYNNADISWDGTYLGNKCPTTDYWYVINIESIDRMLTGHFTLKRQ